MGQRTWLVCLLLLAVTFGLFSHVAVEAGDLAYSLTVTTSGPGSVGDGGGLTCPGTCSVNYPAGTPVVLTATEASGSNFAGWGGSCTPSGSTCTLTMDGPKSVTVAFSSPTTVPSGLGLYDDFSSPRLNPELWKQVREQVREIRDGAVVLAVGDTSDPAELYTSNTGIRHVNPPYPLTSVQADLTLTTAEPPPDGYARMRLRGAFYNNGHDGGSPPATGNTGDVWAQIILRAGVTGPELAYYIMRCNDSSCTGTTNLVAPTVLAAAQFNQAYTVRIAWDPASNAFTFTGGGQSATVVPEDPINIVSAPRFRDLQVRAEIRSGSGAGGPGYAAGTADNVYVNGNLYDTFEGPWLDRGKWNSPDTVREVRSGQLAVQAFVAAGATGQQNTLGVANPAAVTAMAADVAVETLTFSNSSQAGYARAGLQGSFYSTQATPTSADGDVLAAVSYGPGSTTGTLMLYFQASRGPSQLAFHSFALDLPVAQTHGLLLQWNGSVFTYGYDDHAWTFDPKPLAPVGSPTPYSPFKGIASAAGATPTSSAELRAAYDNVAVIGPVINTPTGSTITVQPTDTTTGTMPVATTFSNVTQPGVTSLTTTEGGPSPPLGFQLSDPPRYYELTTTATYSGQITVCINYSGVSYTDPASLRLFHYEAGSLVDRTVSLNTATNIICAQVTSLSPFAILEVRYAFTGFFRPVDNLPALNSVKAGSAVPVKFSLGGNMGINILAPGYPASGVTPCDAAAPVTTVEETVTAGSSSLAYDASAGQYVYIWKTSSEWLGTCRQLVVGLSDGTYHRANFKFK